MSRRLANGERGAGSILVLGAVAVALTALLVVLTLAAGYDARHRAAAAADLAALAGAGQVGFGAEPACALARTVAAANGGVLRSCTVEGEQVVVSVAATIVGPTSWLPDPVRWARAGPTTVGLVSGGQAAADRLALPIADSYRITARFGDSGPHWVSGRHSGLDFATEPGVPVFAAARGQVTAAGPAGRYGNLVAIDHGGVVTYYAHLSAVTVTVGDVVETGRQVGSVGSSGNATGPHLHFEVRVGGVARDPAAFLAVSPAQ
jgi:secretion/DNA translocation related TadE-like protein